MKNTFGNTISLTLFGESHGPAIGAVLDGLPPGLVIEERSRRRVRRRIAWNLSAASLRDARPVRRSVS